MDDLSGNSLGRASGLKALIGPNTHSANFYEKDDPVSENHRRRDNWGVFRVLHLGFKVIDEEAKNGFKKYSRQEQAIIIDQRKYQFERILRNGSFYPGEINDYRTKVQNRVESIYSPYIKWSRK